MRGKPVVTGEERGIASSMSYEAKAKGIIRGMRIGEIRKRFPEVIVLGSDYDTYVLYAQRMYNIVRRYTPLVEEYSIDECFADLTGLSESSGKTYEEIGREIKNDLEKSLGLSFSVGISVNKVTAKIASKWNKPSGLVVIPADDLPEYLHRLSIDKIWGIGWRTALDLKKQGIMTAADFTLRDRIWIGGMAKPFREIYEELHGRFVHELNIKPDERISISRTRTFRPPSTDRDFIFSELSRNIEEASYSLRERSMFAGRLYFFIKTQEFRYLGSEVRLQSPLSLPSEIIAAVRSEFAKIFHPGILYRTTGITLSELISEKAKAASLFEDKKSSDSLYKTIDRLVRKYDRSLIFLGSSLASISKRGQTASGPKVKGNVYRKRFNMPFLGVVR